MAGLVAYGRGGQSPWLWLVIVGGGVCLYLIGRVRGRPLNARWSNVGDSLFLVNAPWWLRAGVFAMIGGGSLYHLASGHYRWYWWLLPAVAWLAFSWVVATRTSPGTD